MKEQQSFNADADEMPTVRVTQEPDIRKEVGRSSLNILETVMAKNKLSPGRSKTADASKLLRSG